MNPRTHCPLCGRPWEGKPEEICPQNHDAGQLIKALRRNQDEEFERLKTRNERMQKIIDLLSRVES